MALDMLIDERGKSLAAVSGVKAQAAAADEVVYARTTTYMNLSGEGIAPLARELGISPENIIVLHDELDLPAGQVRIKRGGNENGHNGLKSLTEHLGTREYIRVRMGIGRPTDGQPVPDWVLGPVEGGKQLEDQLHLAAEAVDLIVSEGLEKAQNKVHSKR